MGLFGEIYRNLLNEIRAEDAYSRFYSNMPKEDFDAIVAGEENIDKFIQFFLNCVRDGVSTKDEAVAALEAYRNADALVKQNVKKKMESGEYDDAEDVKDSIEYFSNGGGILSKKSFAKEGYVKIKENDRWLATCTTNYQANNSVFGKLGAKWCTASDRHGNFDGYRMFDNYSSESALIQFRWKGKVDDAYSDNLEPLDTGDEGFVGEEIPYNYQIIQVSAKMPDDEGSANILGGGGLCDFNNNGISRHTLLSLVGEDMYQILENEEIMGKLITMTRNMKSKELEFQKYTEKSTQRKYAKRRKIAEEKYDKLCEQCNKKIEKKKEFVYSKWKDFVDSGHKNLDLVQRILNTQWDNIKSAEGGEEYIAGVGYVMVTTEVIGNKHDMAIFHPTLGFFKQAQLYTDENGMPDAKIGYSRYQKATPIDEWGAVCIICEYFGDENDTQYKPVCDIGYVGHGDKFIGGVSIHTTVNDYEMDEFIRIKFDRQGEKKYMLYDVRAGNLIDIGEVGIVKGFEGDDKTCFFNAVLNGSGDIPDLFMYNKEKGEFKPVPEDIAYAARNVSQMVVVNKDGKSQTVIADNGVKYNVNSTEKIAYVNEWEKRNEFVPIAFLETMLQESNSNERYVHNVLFRKTGDLVFGFNSLQHVGIKDENTCFSFLKRGANPKIVFYDNGEYYTLQSSFTGGNKIPCDKNGKTERDKLSDYNMEKYWNGYSTETQAQMDDMWAERNGDNGSGNGSEAMRDWDDDDAYLFNFKRNNPYMQNTEDDRNKKLYTTLQQGYDSDEWKDAYYGDKDPEAHDKEWQRLWQPAHDYMKKPRNEREPGWLGKFIDKVENAPAPEYMRRNPYYRVDKHGKPIEQPWYDEDEIPAIPSDRVIRESKNNENLNKMKSIWDRMGLND